MIKRRYFKLIPMVLSALFFISPAAYAANEWENIFRDLSSGNTITPGVTQQATLYNSGVQFVITNNNGVVNDFGGTDTINLGVKGNGVNLNFNGTQPALIAWSMQNKDALMKAIFGNAPDAAISGMTNGQMATQQLFSATLGSPENFGISFIPVSNRDIVLKGQYDFMEIDKSDATGGSGLLTYDNKFGTDNDKSVGITIPFRQLDVDDQVDSTYQNVSFIPHFKKRWYMSQSLTEVTFHVNLGLTYMESSVFPDGGGFLDYGMGTNAKYAYALNDQLSLNAGLGYQVIKRDIPSDLVPKELRWVSDSFNDLDPEHSITPSLGVFYSIMPNKLSFRGEVFRIHQVVGDAISDYENQTVMLGVFSFSATDKIRASIGYKQSFEMKDITDQSVIFDFKMRW
ncbi:hypothetical protein [Desulforegula conservatrix]|uniref:hypothetical protein n=1 Tax=Desulforegula conservatrix TaxID=153026 RepID=UPI000404A0E5|nr:hypothetical protein [Desulforegula conservatrix]